MATLLLIEDDPRVRETVASGLKTKGYEVVAAEDAQSGLRLLTDDVDLVLLDLILPDKSGMEVLGDLRRIRPGVPVLLLTALDNTDTKVQGLDGGADDYITKPFSIEELAARIRARMRLREEPQERVTVGSITLDLASHQVLLNDEEVPLSARELGLLTTFMQHRGEVLSRDDLLRAVWNMDFDPGSNVVDVYVRALRQKIGNDFIETVRGQGYRFVAPEADMAGDAS
ncbi:MAG TPA: response regulator transcription factor [Actinomycetota bacterium]|nr:response regulator transcription factor [Actinomycetota bacterium]